MKFWVAVIASAFLVAGCHEGAGHPAPGSPSAASSAPSTLSTEEDRAYQEAIEKVDGWLDTWQREGVAGASQLLDPSEQLPPGTPDAFPLLSGRALSYDRCRFDSPDRFILRVDVDLHFRNADGGAWGEGTNTRFFAFSRAEGSLVLHIATSPGFSTDAGSTCNLQGTVSPRP